MEKDAKSQHSSSQRATLIEKLLNQLTPQQREVAYQSYFEQEKKSIEEYGEGALAAVLQENILLYIAGLKHSTLMYERLKPDGPEHQWVWGQLRSMAEIIKDHSDRYFEAIKER